jgi:mediator of RNA polymerase II transcription subunit 27
LIAVIVLKGLMIESVVVRGIDESFTTDDGKPDPWTQSRYAVLRKVTENANAAMLHYYSPLMPELSLRSFLVRMREP